MPEEGYKTITIPVEVHVDLEKLAEKNHRSIPKQIEHLIAEAKKKEA